MNDVLCCLKTLDIKSQEYIVVACSGGPDSMCLLHVLKSLGYLVVCAHVNHKLRKESDLEYQFVLEYCQSHDIIFEGIELDGYSGNFEAYARNFRYSFFEKLLVKYNSKYLFTAHHGDDLIETVLMRLVRGSSLKGYHGFSLFTSRDNYTIIRPLIYLTKDMVVSYNKENNIEYVVDNSNYSGTYMRNRFRAHVLPFLKEEDSLVHEKFLLFSNEVKEASDYIFKHVDTILGDVYVQKCLDINKYLELDCYMQKRVLYRILEELYPDNLYLVDNNHVNEIIKVIKSDKPNIIMRIPNNISVVKSYTSLRFVDKMDSDEPYNLEYYDGIIVNDHVFKSSNTDKTTNDVIRLNSQDIKLPLYIRTRQNGDRMHVKNMLGTKKVNDIFIDNKVNFEKRDTWPIVVDANNTILWVPGLKKSDFDIPINGEYDIILEYLKKGEKL